MSDTIDDDAPAWTGESRAFAELRDMAKGIEDGDREGKRALIVDMASSGLNLADAQAILKGLWGKSLGTARALADEYKDACKARQAAMRAAGSDDTPDPRTPHADHLVDLVDRAGFAVWRDLRTSAGMVTIAAASHCRLGTREATDALIRLWAADPLPNVRVPSKNAVDDASRFLAARIGDGDEYTSSTRYAPIRSGDRLTGVVIDHGDADRTALHVSATGIVRIDAENIDRLGVRFVRSSTSIAFPDHEPATVAEGVGILAELVSLQQREVMALFGVIVASMLAGPVTLPVIAVIGAHGTGKTAIAAMLKNLLDPATNVTDGAPKSTDDFLVAANGCRCLVLDNMAKIERDMSDAICRVANGASSTRRKLYSDEDKHTLAPHSTVILTSIEVNILTQADLVDRMVGFEPLALAQRRSDAEQARLVAARVPKLRGALLAALSIVLKHLDQSATVAGDRLVAVVQALRALDRGMRRSGFEAAFLDQRKAGAARVVMANPIARATLYGVIAGHTDDKKDCEWEGDMSALLTKVLPYWHRDIQMPRDAGALGRFIKTSTQAYAMMGVAITFRRTATERTTKIIVPASIVRMLGDVSDHGDDPQAGVIVRFPRPHR